MLKVEREALAEKYLRELDSAQGQWAGIREELEERAQVLQGENEQLNLINQTQVKDLENISKVVDTQRVKIDNLTGELKQSRE
jgi:hypothetical protein